jgi:hypothetical protein
MVATETLLPVIDEARLYTRTKLQSLKSTIGFNLAGLQYLRNELEVEGWLAGRLIGSFITARHKLNITNGLPGIRFFEDAPAILAAAGKKKKRKTTKT